MGNRPFSDIYYKQYLNEGKLMGSRCKKCNTYYLPPRPICISCYACDMEWFESKGKGRLAAFSSIAIGPPSMIEEGFDRHNPYCVGVVELEEGVRVDARIVDVDAKNPESIKVGASLTVKYLHRGEGDNKKTILAFEPAG